MRSLKEDKFQEVVLLVKTMAGLAIKTIKQKTWDRLLTLFTVIYILISIKKVEWQCTLAEIDLFQQLPHFFYPI